MRTQPVNSQNPIARDFQNVVDDAHELLKTVEREGEGKVNEVRSRVQDSLDAAKTKLVDVGGKVQESAKEYAATTDQYVHAHPWHAIGVGALAGALVGFLIARR
jgi:ElaB protein